MVTIAKKQGKLGEMDIDFAESYDQEDDVYYVSFQTGEPSYVMEIDDVLLFEVGMFTNMPTGFRILNFSKNKVAEVSFSAKSIKKAFSPMQNKLRSRFDARTREIERSLERVLA